MHTRNARTRWIAPALVALAGFALTTPPAAAQQRSSTTITNNDGKTSTVVRTLINGVEYRVELENDAITEVTADGLEVEYTYDDGVVSIEGEDVTIVVPRAGQVGAIRLEGLAGLNPDRLIARVNPPRGFIDGNDWRGWAGVEPPRTMVGLTQASLGDQLRGHLGLKEGEGTVVLSVVEGLPADEAGLEAGDVLIEIAGEPVEGTATLTEALAEREPGDVLGVVVLRKGSPVSLEIELAAHDPARLNPFFAEPGLRFDGDGRWEVFPRRLDRFGDAEIEADIEAQFDEFLREMDGALDEEVLEQVRESRERARAALERSREAVRRAQIEALAQRELLLRDGDGRAIVIDGEARTARERAQADALRFERDELLARGRALAHKLMDTIQDEDASEEVAEELESAIERAMALHHRYEPLRRVTQRRDHPMHAEAEALRRERDEAHDTLLDLTRDLEVRLDRADEPAERLAIAEQILEVSNRAADLHSDYQEIHEQMQRSGRGVRGGRDGGDDNADRLDEIENRFEALEDRLDRLLDAIEGGQEDSQDE